MILINMEVYNHLDIIANRPLNRWDHDRISPGAVGSVGDVNLQSRLKRSYPDLAPYYSKFSSHKRESKFGSNVTDGSKIGYNSGGGPARVRDSNWGGRRDFKTNHGWVYQDLRAPDRNITPYLGATPGYSWQNRLATTYRALHTGDLFLPLPGEYSLSPGEIPRGGSTPGSYLEGDVVSSNAASAYKALNSTTSGTGTTSSGTGTTGSGTGTQNSRGMWGVPNGAASITGGLGSITQGAVASGTAY